MLRRYLEWLDGEFFELTSNIPYVVTQKQLQKVINLVKFHALFGNSIDLSDAQIFDSYAILYLFADSSFRRFLVENPLFIHQVVPLYRLRGKDHLSLSTTILTRSLEKDWISGTFENKMIPKMMADLILNEVSKNSGKLDLQTINYDNTLEYRKATQLLPNPNQEWMLKGILHSVTHFLKPGNTTVSDYKGNPPDQYSILLEIVNILETNRKDETQQAKELRKQHAAQVNELLRFIKDNVTEENYQYQSSVLTALRQKLDIKSNQYQEFAETLFHAWSYAIKRGISSSGSSLFQLKRRSIPIGLYLESKTDSLVPINSKTNISKQIQKAVFSLTELNPSLLTWDEISLLVKETRTQAKLFQESLMSQNSNETLHALANHIDKLMNSYYSLKRKDNLDPFRNTPFIWLIKEGIPIGVGISFSKYSKIPNSFSYVKMNTQEIILKILSYAGNIAVYNTLLDIGKKMKIESHNI